MSRENENEDMSRWDENEDTGVDGMRIEILVNEDEGMEMMMSEGESCK